MANNEISPAILNNQITLDEAKAFTAKVLDRYRNPFIEHLWISISAQYTAKMKMRCVQILQKYFAVNQCVPSYMALGFAAYILFMKSHQNADGKYIGTINCKEYTITDDAASALHTHWLGENTATVVSFILKDISLWDIDLTLLNGFSDAVTKYLNALIENGFKQSFANI